MSRDMKPRKRSAPARKKSGGGMLVGLFLGLVLGDADNQKAKLAMLGIEAAVQQVMVQEKVWYRVRLGPFRKMEDVNRMRSELAGQGLEANVVKKD